MIRFLLACSLLCIALASAAFSAEPSDWSKKKISQITIEADKAERTKNWALAIELGEQLLQANRARYGKENARCLASLIRLNGFYHRANRLTEVAGRLEQAYLLSKKRLGINDKQTTKTRFLFYKFLVADKQYDKAILLVEENLNNIKPSIKQNDRQRRYLNQLRFLYGIKGDYEKEALILQQVILLGTGQSGYDYRDHKKAVLDLARNYCRRKLLREFTDFVKEQKLYYFCKQDGSTVDQ